jgi:IS5 family transposase
LSQNPANVRALPEKDRSDIGERKEGRKRETEERIRKENIRVSQKCISGSPNW